MREPLRCYCGADMVQRVSKKYGSKFWGCSTWPDCDGAVGAHQDTGEPKGFPVDKATRQLRIKCHNLFDRKWKGGGISRNQAYKWLATAMGLSKGQAHIAMFDREKCLTLINILEGESECSSGSQDEGDQERTRQPAFFKRS